MPQSPADCSKTGSKSDPAHTAKQLLLHLFLKPPMEVKASGLHVVLSRTGTQVPCQAQKPYIKHTASLLEMYPQRLRVNHSHSNHGGLLAGCRRYADSKQTALAHSAAELSTMAACKNSRGIWGEMRDCHKWPHQGKAKQKHTDGLAGSHMAGCYHGCGAATRSLELLPAHAPAAWPMLRPMMLTTQVHPHVCAVEPCKHRPAVAHRSRG